RFRHGLLVPLVATAWRMERMGVRVFARHVEVLAARARRGKTTATLPLLEGILKDERRHVAACEWALARLLTSAEYGDLVRLCAQIDRVERMFGVLGAALLFGMGVVLCLGRTSSWFRSELSLRSSVRHR